jgi:hypothetical protein
MSNYRTQNTLLMGFNNTLFRQNKHSNQVFLQHSKQSNFRGFPAQIHIQDSQNNLKLRLFQPTTLTTKKGFTHSPPKTRSTALHHPAQTALRQQAIQTPHSYNQDHPKDQSRPCFPTVRRTSRIPTHNSLQQTRANQASHRQPAKCSPANDT